MTDVRLPQLRSPVGRAVVPVLAGAALIAVIGLFTWGVAAYIARGDEPTSERLAPSTFRLGAVESIAEEVRERGPLLIPGLNTTIGERSIVVNHTGSIDSQGWEVYWAYPADRDGSCLIESVRGTSDVHRLRRPHDRRDRSGAADQRRAARSSRTSGR